MNNNIDDDIYNVDAYSEKELYNILDVFNPTDRELEAKILSFINKYNNSNDIDSLRLHTFFVDIYKRFFYVEEYKDEDEYEVEGFTNMNNNDNDKDIINTDSNKNGNIQLTSSLNYAKGKLNPILKQTYQRIITIDSQYRDSTNNLSTQFTLNFSETLKDVVSLKLYAVQIPYTWYTISKSYGSNFIYIKGNSPGLSNGMYDISINIPPGNYSLTTISNTNDTNNSISSAIQKAFTNLPNIYKDISFANTNLAYNVNQCKATFNIDIQIHYNESYYYLNFPGDFRSPLSTNTIQNINRNYYLSSFLGFNDLSYSTCSIYSLLNVNDLDNTTSIYALDNSNNTIQIIQYYNTDPTLSYIPGSSTLLNTISISFPNTSSNITQYELYKNIRDTIATSIYLNRPNHTDSFVIHKQVSSTLDPSNIPLDHVGNYYYQWQIKLNRNYIQNYPGYKICLAVPMDTNIWVGSYSSFRFDSSYNEINNLISETNLYYSNYNISSNIYFTLKCNDISYSDISNTSYYAYQGLNDFSYNLTQASNYSLDTVIAEINKGFTTINNNYANISYTNNSKFFNISTSTLFSESKTKTLAYVENNTFNIAFDIQNTFGTPLFNIYLKNNLLGKFFPSIVENTTDFLDISVNSNVKKTPYSMTLTNNTYILTDKTKFINFPSLTNSCVMMVASSTFALDKRGIKTMDYINIDYRQYSFLLGDMVNLINNTIQNYKNPIGWKPFLNTVFSAEFDPVDSTTINTKLELIINNIINQNHYSIYFYDNNKLSFWYDKLKLNDASYDLSQNSAYSLINGTSGALASDNITLSSDNSNNIIELIPIDKGVIGDGIIRIKIPVDNTKGTKLYSRVELFEAINTLFQKDERTSGTNISYITLNNLQYTKIRWNVNKVYTSIDYKLVFYDIYSFVSCFLGNSSIRNATWDTTLGWIMGFHDLQEYPLTIDNLSNGYYYDISNSDITNNEYSINTDIPYRKLVSLTGDTTVSINLYNYFMIILDDFNPSHLNDGLVTITPKDNNLTLPSYANRTKYICDPTTTNKIYTGITDIASNNLTRNQIYSINQIINTQNTRKKSTNSGVYASDIFGLIPIKTSGYTPGQLYVEYGGTLQAQDRIYFGPVNIHRMAISLLNDRGEVVDLNNANWSLQFICEQLYQNNNDVKS